MSASAALRGYQGGLPPLGVNSDERLARRAARGDDSAFEAIFRRYHQDLYRFCLAMVGRPQDAQDAVQNTMVKVLRALPGEKRAIQLKPWLYRIARNEAVEILRRRRDGVELTDEQPQPTGEIAETAEAREKLRRLLADLAELPERQRAMLVMRELGGFGFEEIGEAFETSGSVARQTLYEARLSLRQMEAGREMDCDRVTRELSDADGRTSRRRELRSHLRECPDCRAFAESIRQRRSELAAIAPLPLAASAALFHGALAGSSSGGAAVSGSAAGGGLAGGIGAGAGKVAAGSALAKSVAAVAVVAAVGVTAANRSGLIDVPIVGGGADATKSSSSTHATGESDRLEAGHASSGSASRTAAGPGAGRSAHSGSGGGAAPRRASGESATVQHHSHAHAGRHGGHRPASSPAGEGASEGLPPASEHGQETAAAHKSPHANPTPGSHERPVTSAPPKEHPAPPPAVEPEASAPEAPVSEPEEPSGEKGPPSSPPSGKSVHAPEG